MMRRLIFLAFVAGLSGVAGLSVGLLYAPAPGAETRGRLATVFEEHEDTVEELLTLGREAVSDLVEAVSGTVNAEDDS